MKVEVVGSGAGDLKMLRWSFEFGDVLRREMSPSREQ
jgi:hypothetical protein